MPETLAQMLAALTPAQRADLRLDAAVTEAVASADLARGAALTLTLGADDTDDTAIGAEGR